MWESLKVAGLAVLALGFVVLLVVSAWAEGDDWDDDKGKGE
jgi:hypothetical protein